MSHTIDLTITDIRFIIENFEEGKKIFDYSNCQFDVPYTIAKVFKKDVEYYFKLGCNVEYDKENDLYNISIPKSFTFKIVKSSNDSFLEFEKDGNYLGKLRDLPTEFDLFYMRMGLTDFGEKLLAYSKKIGIENLSDAYNSLKFIEQSFGVTICPE